MKTRTIEYYRLWDGGTWDTDYIEIPADTPEDRIAQAVQEAANKIDWNDDVPVIVGVYSLCDPDEDYEDEDEDESS